MMIVNLYLSAIDKAKSSKQSTDDSDPRVIVVKQETPQQLKNQHKRRAKSASSNDLT